MAVDVVTLQIKVDASQVSEAINRLGGLSASAATIEARTNAATVSTGRLNNALLGLSRQATGTSPVLAKMADVLLSMTLTSLQTTGVLVGLTAVAVAYKKISDNAKEASEATKTMKDRLDELVRAQGPGTGLGDRAFAQFEVNRLEAEIRYRRGRGFPIGDRGWELAQARQRLRAATDATATVLDPLEVQVPRTPARPTLPPLPLAPDRTTNTPGSILLGLFGGPSTDTGGINMAIVDRVVQEGQRLKAAEEALSDARVRANAALVQSLANVGRAYGGVTDQVLNLAAATMSIYQAGRLPGFGKGRTATHGEMAVGYGSAALAGVGFGQSTGNPILGALGGGAAGFGMAGPAGAIVGAVGGIVSGLLESGRRAAEAQRQWQMALQNFEDMWDTLTPEQQTERAFERMTGGRSVDDVRRLIDEYSALPLYLRPTSTITMLEEWLASYERQMAQAGEVTRDAAAAERELYDARFRALNAPTGFNVSYYGWDAGFGGGVPSTAKGDKDIEVKVYVDGEEVATRVEKRYGRSALRGGGQPLVFSTR